MGILFVLLAAVFTSISNFCMRKSIDAGGSSKAYLVVQLSISFLVMVLLNPIRTHNYSWDLTAVGLGLLGGCIFGMLMWGVGKTLENGPPGLSFAVLNSATIVPAVLMLVLFGPRFGHGYTFWNAFGSAIVVLGLIWAGWTSEKNPRKLIWSLFALFIFIFHMFFLVYLQWWAMLLRENLPFSSLLPFSISPDRVEWFMPAVVFVGAAIQIGIYLIQEKKKPNKTEVAYGMLGGITNGACTFFLILAPQKALPWENAMLFPIFSVSIILICNGWAQLIYKEKINWKANILCIAGILFGTISWQNL